MLKNNNESKPGDDLDRALDAALAKYASAEPRTGLEERILANLRAADATIVQGWWNWRRAAVLAAALIVSAALVWRWSQPRHPQIAVHPSLPRVAPVAPEVANHEASSRPPRATVVRHKRVPRLSQRDIVAANPKLDVFPSPLPLSEQEKLLAIYVGQYPEHAALLAEARMDDLRHEAEERQAIADERDGRQ